ncbi:hypothetical protein [Nocardioides mangrovi]|uniref:GH16 domain-containing protein n=1 Tax=Nocardioides mangrovi TaxID=2874580 RepID=A0ABS7U905_9ACTN|nr:hypothetical protein [Nocardioides mangrovi]MBZ5737464.1 hypothetical protein [Nocardioides mangrovi]
MKTALLGIAALLAGLVTTIGPSVPVATAARPHPARLDVSPGVYVGGQRLTWTGTLGRRGVRPLQLQFNMGSVVGGVWDTVEGFHAKSRADGSFSFHYQAPSMFGISYRVVGGGRATPAHTFSAKTQDLTIGVTGQALSTTGLPALVAAGEPYGITVDTTPDDLVRASDSADLPVFRGRHLTLQKRVGKAGRWRTVAHAKVRSDGSGRFTGLPGRAGTTVYRVRAEDYTVRGNRIGWTQSFPLYVLVGQHAQESYAVSHPPGRRASTAAARTTTTPRLGAQPQTASQAHAWYPSVFDFAWEYGQSLSSPPSRGTDLHGSWVDRSTGTGRVAKYNGGLDLESKRYSGPGPGDFGTTTATMTGNAMTSGRWETSLRIRNAFERGGNAYQVLAELVPAKASDYDCGAHNVTIASISPFSRQVHYGVRSGRTTWSGTARARYTPLANAYNVAVEVTGDHLTWFLNGAAVGSVVDRDAVPGVPMTLRLSLLGDGDEEMDQTSLISDWQRGFPASTGQATVSSKHLASKRVPAAC